MSHTSAGIAYERSGPAGGTPVVLLHAGVADRRMWDPLWPALCAEQDAVRIDLRGCGGSTARPPGVLSHVEDVLDTLDELDVRRCHLVGASFGAGLAVELALTRPSLAASLLLSAPGGALIAKATPDLGAFFDAERAALARGDVEAAVEANLATWVDGKRRTASVDPRVRESVREMQRRAFEVTAGWDDLEEEELEPLALDRLADIAAPTLVLVGSLDLDAIQDTALRVTSGITGAQRVDWLDVAHLPSMERPDDFLALLFGWVTSSGR